MFKNYIKAAWRNIIRNRVITLINLFGLSVALVAFIFIALWVQNELNFDGYHKNAKDIYLARTKYDATGEPGSVTPFPLAEALKKESTTDYVARMAWWGGVLKVGGQLYNQNERGIAVDGDWFKIFDYKVVSGDLNSFSRNKFSLVFTESKAKQLFGNKNPIGQVVNIDTTLYQVSAIVKDNPVNSSLQFEMFAPMAARMDYRQGDLNNWYNSSYRTFVKVHANTNVGAFEKNITARSLYESKGKGFSIVLQPLRDLHFDTISSDPFIRRGNRTAVFVFSVLGILLLVTASINYVNLTIAKANTRTKEISIRRIVGSSRKQLFIQFLTESFLLCLIALCISMIAMWIALPAFNDLTGYIFELSLASKILWSIFLGTLLFTTLLNGVLPALTMSYFKPLNYLQGNTILKFKSVFLRKGLIVFQFVTGVIFIVGTIVIFQQMKLARTSAAQYNRSQVVTFRLPWSVMQKSDDDNKQAVLLVQTIKNDLQKSSAIQAVSAASSAIEGGMSSGGIANWYWNGMDTSVKTSVSWVAVDIEAKNIFNLGLKEGRWFSNSDDRKNYVLNETAVENLHIHQPVIGQTFARSGGDTGQIIGVVKDFAFRSLYDKITPLVFSGTDNEWKFDFFVKIAPGNVPKVMDIINATWKKYVKDAPFDYQFMNEAFNNLYKNDLKLSGLVFIFSCISIVISALGLFGLSAFVAERRQKEIGIRKVFGASVIRITAMLSKDLLILIFLSVILAIPVAWWAMDKWLQNFAYRVHIHWWIFLAAGMIVISIALATTIFQSVKAAMANPVKALRME
ncbi:MAG: ABC transporter permease [Chitinophagaceae bacterium]|nr:ABC transporter permease [Chitinophagaceae bacterium]